MTSFLSRCCNFCSAIFSHSLDNETLIGTCRVSLDTFYCVLPYLFLYSSASSFVVCVHIRCASRLPQCQRGRALTSLLSYMLTQFRIIDLLNLTMGFVFAFHLAAVRFFPLSHNWVRRVGWLTCRFLCDCSLESFVTFFSGSYRRWEFDKIIEGGSCCWCVCVDIANDSYTFFRSLIAYVKSFSVQFKTSSSRECFSETLL